MVRAGCSSASSLGHRSAAHSSICNSTNPPRSSFLPHRPHLAAQAALVVPQLQHAAGAAPATCHARVGAASARAAAASAPPAQHGALQLTVQPHQLHRAAQLVHQAGVGEHEGQHGGLVRHGDRRRGTLLRCDRPAGQGRSSRAGATGSTAAGDGCCCAARPPRQPSSYLAMCSAPTCCPAPPAWGPACG